MGKLTKTIAVLLVTLLLASATGVPALAATTAPMASTQMAQTQNLSAYDAGDVAAINAMIESNAGLSARYNVNEPWKWDFVDFAGGSRAVGIRLSVEVSGEIGGAIRLSNLPELQSIALADVGIAEIELSMLPKVESFAARGNAIKDLDLSGMPNLTSVQVDTNFYNKSWSKTCNTFESVSINGCRKIERFSLNHAAHGYLNLIVNKFTNQDGSTVIFNHPDNGKIQMYYQWLTQPKWETRFQFYYPRSDIKSWKFSASTVKTENTYTSDPRHITMYPQKTKKVTVSVTTKSAATTQPTAKVAKVNFPQANARITANKSLSVPAVAYTSDGKTAKVTYTSANAQVATVNSKGKIVAKSPGTTTITAKSGSKKDTLKVTVVAAGTKAIKVSKVTSNVPRLMRVGVTKFITAKYTPTKATDVKVTYASSNSRVVSVDKSGKLVAKQAGTATITVKAGGKSRRYQVTVT